jgi:phosphatidylinositol-3-phosphatase
MKKFILLFYSLFTYIQAFAQSDSVTTVTIILENKAKGQVIGSTNAPYINSLVPQGALFTEYYAITHPSQMNYIALVAGLVYSPNNDIDMGAGSKSDKNISSEFKKLGLLIETYAEGLDSAGSVKYTNGLYAGKHDPLRNFSNVDQKTRKPLTALPTNYNQLGKVVYIIPNLVNDMHNGAIPAAVKAGDDWMKTNVYAQRVIQWALQGKIRLVITFDEDDNSSANNIPFIMIGNNVNKGVIISTGYNHYNYLGTLLDWYGVPRFAGSIGKAAMSGWKQIVVNPPPIDTTKCYKWVVAIRRDTIITKTVSTHYDSLRVEIACDTVTPPPPTGDGIYRGIYVNGFSGIAGNTAKENNLISDLNRWKMNYVSTYSTATSVAASNLIKRIKRETKVTEIAPAGSSLPEFTTWSNYNQAQPDSNDFTGFQLEIEAYNQSDIAGAWSSEVSLIKSLIPLKAAANIIPTINYSGWWTKTPMNVQTPDTLVKYCAWSNLHDYQTTPNFEYLKTRCNDLNASAKKQGKIFTIRVLFSAEPAFMQNYLKTHTLDDSYAIVKTTFDAQHYTNLKMDGYIVFHLDFLRVSQPAPVSTALKILRAPVQLFKAVPFHSADDFKNITDTNHLKMATMPE